VKCQQIESDFYALIIVFDGGYTGRTMPKKTKGSNFYFIYLTIALMKTGLLNQLNYEYSNESSKSIKPKCRKNYRCRWNRNLIKRALRINFLGA